MDLIHIQEFGLITNGNRIKIIDAEIFQNQGKKGEVLTNELVVACKDKAIKIN